LTRDEVVTEVRAARETAEEVSGDRTSGKGRTKGKGRGGASSGTRGKAAARLPTAKVFRVPGGGKLTIERARGLDAESYRAAARLLLDHADRLDPRSERLDPSTGSEPQPECSPELHPDVAA
jgi:hypothetical protein